MHIEMDFCGKFCYGVCFLVIEVMNNIKDITYYQLANLQLILTSTGGGFRESKRATELSKLLGVNILPWQVMLQQFLKSLTCVYIMIFFSFIL